MNDTIEVQDDITIRTAIRAGDDNGAMGSGVGDDGGTFGGGVGKSGHIGSGVG